MTDHQHNWRLLSESFDRELSKEEQDLLDSFIAEDETPREFERLFCRIRDCSLHQKPNLESEPSQTQSLSDKKKNALRFMIESEMEKQHVPLANRDVLVACELVSQSAIGLGELTEKISEWNSDSKTFSAFLKDEYSVPEGNFSKIEAHVSDTIFSQTIDQTLLDDVVTAFKQQISEVDCTAFEDGSDDFVSVEFVNRLDQTNAGENGAFESLLAQLVKESRSVISQTKMFSHRLRLKPVVDEITLRLVGRKKLNKGQLGCYYRMVGIANRRLFESDPEFCDSLLPLIGKRRIVVRQVVNALHQLEKEEPKFVQMFNLRFFAGLTSQQVAGLLELAEEEVSAECDYGTARLRQLLEVKSR